VLSVHTTDAHSYFKVRTLQIGAELAVMLLLMMMLQPSPPLLLLLMMMLLLYWAYYSHTSLPSL
jgi:hypothetical protein